MVGLLHELSLDLKGSSFLLFTHDLSLACVLGQIHSLSFSSYQAAKPVR